MPTVFDADRKSLGEIARETRALAEQGARGDDHAARALAAARSRSPTSAMFGITRFTAVINPPQAAILAVGAVEQRAVVRDGEVVAAPDR